jgi:hypothetical protein
MGGYSLTGAWRRAGGDERRRERQTGAIDGGKSAKREERNAME